MNDLNINIALARAMGWQLLSETDFWMDDKIGIYDGFKDVIVCQDFKQLRGWKVFDYRDPVIFVAICKRWELNIDYKYMSVCYTDGEVSPPVYIRKKDGLCIEKAAALTVIELAKRGAK